jgi:hypothetical protein
VIYQCYHLAEQKPVLFSGRLYRPFGLTPELNPEIVACEELCDAARRLQLCEFAAMLHLWRHPPEDGHDWIGFTSHRQLEKTPFVFTSEVQIREPLKSHDAVAWFRQEYPHSLARQAEMHHPGILSYVHQMMRQHQPSLGQSWWDSRHGFFSSYWAMTKASFRRYMEDWLYPAIKYSLTMMDREPYLRHHPRAASYALERLFSAWALAGGRRIYDAPSGRTWIGGQSTVTH